MNWRLPIRNTPTARTARVKTMNTPRRKVPDISILLSLVEKLGDEFLLALLQFIVGAFHQNVPVMNHGDAIGYGPGGRQIVSHHDSGGMSFPMQFQDQLVDFVRSDWIQTRSG